MQSQRQPKCFINLGFAQERTDFNLESQLFKEIPDYSCQKKDTFPGKRHV